MLSSPIAISQKTLDPVTYTFAVVCHRRRRPAECYPDDSRLSKALETLAAFHEEASFLVPTGAVRALDALRGLVQGGKALVIAGDKGCVQQLAVR